MKKWILSALIVLCLLAILWFAGGMVWLRGDGNAAGNTVISNLEDTRTAGERNLRSKERVVEKTHRPEQLIRFYLPELEIDGLGLRAALGKLQAAYVDACRKSGEKPLEFSFDVRGDDRTRLNMKLSGKTFSSSVKLLAAAAGMNVKRNDLVYIFEPVQGDATARTIEVPPDLKSRLGEMAGMSEEEMLHADWRALFDRLGITLDPSLQVTMKANGGVTVDSPDGTDVAKLVALFSQVATDQVVQVKTTSKIIRLGADSEWKFDGTENFTDTDVQLFLRAAAMQKGTDLMTMPSVMNRSGQDAKVEMTREFFIEGETEPITVGKVMDLKAQAVGFGQTMNATYTDTDAERIEEDVVQIRELAKLGTDGFSDDGGTRISVQTMPDGSRVVMLVTGELIDRTGVPIRPDKR